MADDKAVIKRLKKKLKLELEYHERTRIERNEFLHDLNTLRAELVDKLAWYIELLASGKNPCLKYLIQSKSRLLGRLRSFPFSWPDKEA